MNDTYRVGFITICPNGSSCGNDNDVIPVTSNYYLKIDAFAPTHKANWYAKFYQQVPSSYTPLRQALARVGRHYAGYTDGINSGMNEDPIQYSCHEFLHPDDRRLLELRQGQDDGERHQLLPGDIGNHDANSGISPRPLLDAGTVSLTVTQEYYSDIRAAGASGCSAVQRRADRNTRTVTTPQFGSVTTSGWTQVTNNTCYPIATIDAATGSCTSTSGGPSSGTAGCIVGTTNAAPGSTANNAGGRRGVLLPE